MIKSHADPRENDQKLFEIASAQGGYFTARQARAAGYYYRLQHYHRSRGNWLVIDRGIFRLRNFPDSPWEDLIRWSLWSCNRKGEPQAVVSHETACAYHELGDFMPAKIHLTVPPGFRKKSPGGCVLHKAKIGTGDMEQAQGFMVTTPLRTLRDLSESKWVEPSRLVQAVKDALARGMVTREQIVKNKGLSRMLRENPE